jgi:hypothetical protein
MTSFQCEAIFGVGLEVGVLSGSKLAEAEELLATSTLSALDARRASPGASGSAAMAMGDAASGCGAGCAKEGVETTTARPSASIHLDVFAGKDFEISFLFKRNNL